MDQKREEVVNIQPNKYKQKTTFLIGWCFPQVRESKNGKQQVRKYGVVWLREPVARQLPADVTASSDHTLTFIKATRPLDSSSPLTGQNTGIEPVRFYLNPGLLQWATSVQKLLKVLSKTFSGSTEVGSLSSPILLPSLSVMGVQGQASGTQPSEGSPHLPPLPILFIVYMRFPCKSLVYLHPPWYLLLRGPKVTQKVSSVKEKNLFFL